MCVPTARIAIGSVRRPPAPYRLTPRAAADLLTIFVEGIERFGERQALSYRRELEETFAMLNDLPGMGRTREALGTEVRSYPHGAHIVLYRPTPDGILVVRVRDGRDDWLPMEA